MTSERFWRWMTSRWILNALWMQVGAALAYQNLQGWTEGIARLLWGLVSTVVGVWIAAALTTLWIRLAHATVAADKPEATR